MAKREAEKATLTTLQKKVLFLFLFIGWILLTALQWRMFSTGATSSPFETLVAFGLINVNIIVLLLLLFLTLRNLTKLLFDHRAPGTQIGQVLLGGGILSFQDLDAVR